MPRTIVKRAGHVRAFSGFAALLAIIALLTGLLVDPIWWVVLRAFTGFSTAGTSMIIESWLNERATNESRGAIFSLYIAITLMGVVGGQLMIPFGDTGTTTFFMICGIVYCLAMLPTLLSTAASPQPLKTGEPGPARPLPQFADLLPRHPACGHRQRCLWHARRRLRPPGGTDRQQCRADDEYDDLCRRGHAVSRPAGFRT